MPDSLRVIRKVSPRLYRAPDDPEFKYPPPMDSVRRWILRNILADCRLYEPVRPPNRIPRRKDSPHPFHQLYITFYESMRATALIEQYAFAWAWTRDDRWLAAARRWLSAACRWDHSDAVEEHFYTANRYMHAFAVGLDLLGEVLPARESQRIVDTLMAIMRRWWPDVQSDRDNSEGGHHAIIDNAHFGIAALALLSKVSEADEWVRTVLHRARKALLPNGCGSDGQPCDGPSFWPYENFWRLQLAEAFRNVLGVDFYREFPDTFRRPLHWFRYHLSIPDRLPNEVYPKANTTVLNDNVAGQLGACAPSLVKLAGLAGDGDLYDLALRDPQFGRLLRFGIGVKNSAAECMAAFGPYGYMFYDPAFKPRARTLSLKTTHVFALKGCRMNEVIVRSDTSVQPRMTGWLRSALGVGTQVCNHVHLQWEGHPVLKQVGTDETQPMAAGTTPAVGGQLETIGTFGPLMQKKNWDCITLSGSRTEQEYWMIRGPLPIFIAAARLKTRRLQFLADNHRPFVRLCGDYWLQFARKPWFNPNAGELRLRFRLHSPLTSSKEDPLLFNAGCGGGCFGGNNFRLGFLGGKDLSFEVVSQRWQAVRVRARSSIRPGTWHTVVIRWGGLNDPNSKPFIEIALDGKRSRITNPVRFGEDRREGLGTGVGTEPKTFYCRPNTHLYFGAAAQRADTALACDLSEITLRCPGRKVFSPTLDHAGLAGETGSGPLAWSFIPVALRQLSARCVLLNAGSRPLAVTGAFPANMRFTSLRLPYVQTGFAGSSLKAFDPRLKGPSTRVIATADTADTLILVFADPSVCVATGQNDFRVKAGGRHFGFTVNSRGNDILSLGKDA